MGKGHTETANNKLNSVGHGTTGDVQADKAYVNGADNRFFNEKLWQIDIVHVPTSKCVAFKSFITEFADSYASSWNSESVYGRMDPMQIYQGTTRTISLGWTVPAIDEREAEKNLHKFEHLVSLLYPTYESHPTAGNTMKASPLLRIKFTNLIQDAGGATSPSPKAVDGGLLCTADGFTLTPNIEMGFFSPGAGMLLPKEYAVSCQLQVIHTHGLGWNDASKAWLSAPKDKFPYGLHRLTGDHSICDKGKYSQPAKNSGSKLKNVKKANNRKVLGGKKK